MKDYRTIYVVHWINLACGLVALAGIAQFAVSVILAIAWSGDYLLFQNFLSDLGGVQANGRDNGAVAHLYNRALVILGCSLIPLFVVLPSIFHSYQSVLRNSGVVTALGLIAFGLTPYDVFYVAHLAALLLWMGGLLVLSLAIAANVGFHGAGGSFLTIATIALLMAIGGFVFAQDHRGHVVYQKVVVLLAALSTFTMVIAVSVSAHRVMKSQREMINHQARQYLRRIQLHGWRRDA